MSGRTFEYSNPVLQVEKKRLWKSDKYVFTFSVLFALCLESNKLVNYFTF